jgi:hypothetical protein
MTLAPSIGVVSHNEMPAVAEAIRRARGNDGLVSGISFGIGASQELRGADRE